MTHTKRICWGLTAAAAAFLAFTSTALAQDDAYDAFPVVELSTDSIDFGDGGGGGGAEVTITNAGDATLHIHEVRVIEEGFIKRKQAAANNPAGEPVQPVFRVVGAPSSLQAGQSASFTVNFEAPKGSNQKQWFGAVQILTNDQSLKSVTVGSGDGAETVYVAHDRGLAQALPRKLRVVLVRLCHGQAVHVHDARALGRRKRVLERAALDPEPAQVPLGERAAQVGTLL